MGRLAATRCFRGTGSRLLRSPQRTREHRHATERSQTLVAIRELNRSSASLPLLCSLQHSLRISRLLRLAALLARASAGMVLRLLDGLAVHTVYSFCKIDENNCKYRNNMLAITVFLT